MLFSVPKTNHRCYTLPHHVSIIKYEEVKLVEDKQSKIGKYFSHESSKTSSAESTKDSDWNCRTLYK